MSTAVINENKARSNGTGFVRRPSHLSSGIDLAAGAHTLAAKNREAEPVIKSELVALIGARNVHLYRRDVEAVVDAVLGGIVEGLEQGNRVELRGFGVFSVTHRPARQGRNPRTGESVSIEEKWVPVFKAGREIGKRLNRKA